MSTGDASDNIRGRSKTSGEANSQKKENAVLMLVGKRKMVILIQIHLYRKLIPKKNCEQRILDSNHNDKDSLDRLPKRCSVKKEKK